jgi:CO/xanthine dehydrogenase Mo-binding subunit
VSEVVFTRRVALGGAAGLAIAFFLPRCRTSGRGAGDPVFAPNAWLEITKDDRVIFTLDRTEMGQGVMTSHAMIIAEELEIAPEKMEVRFAVADRKYDNPSLGFQLTGGSTSVKTSWDPLRSAGATAREALRKAAAKTWGVPLDECRAEEGTIVHASSGKKLTYGECAEAATQFVSEVKTFKRPEDYRVIGRSRVRLDAQPKVEGTARFGIDVRLPGMKTAVLVRCPVIGGKLERYDDKRARAVPGVEAVVPIEGGLAIVANGYWPARSAAKVLDVTWSKSALSSESMRSEYRALLAKKGRTIGQWGFVDRVLSSAEHKIEAEYECPFLAHAPMEPPNATAHVREDGAEIWASTQGPGLARELIVDLTGLSHDRVQIHTTFIGGGFGRRIAQDYIAEAARLSQHMKAPVKVVWSREDDLRHDIYRPMSLHHLEGAAKDGRISAWMHRIVSQSIVSKVGPEFAESMMPNWAPQGMKHLFGSVGGAMYGHAIVDETTVEGAKDLPYAIPNRRIEFGLIDPGVPIGFWRSVGHSYNAFVVESFFDELAQLADADPYLLRRELLADAPRHLAVLDLAAQKAGWGRDLPKGWGRGIAQHFSFDSYAAHVAEVEVVDDAIRVRRVVSAIDCGQVIHPGIVTAQVESAVVFALSAALFGEITFAGGAVEQSNFHDYPLLRMHEMPKVEVHLVKSEAPPTGVGEPGVPPLAPAVANAVFAATGRRLRRLPLKLGSTA